MFSSPVGWKRSLITTAIAVYAPFVMLAVFMLLFERQWGNTATMLRLLPFAPGALPAVVAGQILEWLPGIDRHEMRQLCAPCAPLSSAVSVFLVAWLGRLGREWLVGGAVAAFFIDGIVAYWLLHAIRM